MSTSTSTTPSRPPKSRHLIAQAVKFSPSAIRHEIKSVQGFNAKLAILITRSVGTMLCAYIFTVIALVSLPAILIQANVLQKSDVPNVLTKPGLILIVSWVAQTFIQLVLLSIIMVGQDVQSKAADARSEHTFEDTEKILDAMNTKTEGGLKEVLDAIEALKTK